MDHSSSQWLLRQHDASPLKHISKIRLQFETIAYHLRSLWLFTFSDIKTIIGPCTAFAILQHLGISSFQDNLESRFESQPMNITRIVTMIIWIWVTLLAENISNQRRSIDEDRHNKPWRPLPAGRMTEKQATVLMFTVYPVSVFFGILCGAHLESICLVGLGMWYNDFNGAGSSWFTRNFLNACGITCFLSGSLSALLQINGASPAGPQIAHPLMESSKLRTWFAILWCAILTGIQVQDLPDQEGDKMINRKTMPLVLGDVFTRWTVVVSVIFWSWLCPQFWSLSLSGYIAPMSLGMLIVYRTLCKRTVKNDKLTYKLWNLWFVTFFTLPMQSV